MTMNQPPIEIKRKPKLRWWWFLLVPVLAIGMIVVQAIGPNPPIKIAPETTHLTEPLNEYGLPDYSSYLFDRASEGVTPENNAAVLIFQALGIESVDADYQQAVVAALGMEWPTEVLESPHSPRMLASVGEWIQATQPEFEAETRGRLKTDLVTAAMGRPWSPAEAPFVEPWAQRNAAQVDLLVEGAARQKYFFPPPNLVAGEDPMLFAVLLTDMNVIREAARALKLRAMYHMSRHDYLAAWQDLLATYRLSRHCSHNPYLIHALVSIAIEEMAHETMRALLSHELPREVLQQISEDLATLPARQRMWEVYDVGERFGALDALTRMSRGNQMDEVNVVDQSGQLGAIAGRVRVDWNIALQAANDWYDRLTEAAKLPRAERMAVLQNLEEELALVRPQRKPARMLHSVVSTRARSELLSDVMLSLMIPATFAATKAEDRCTMHRRLIEIAIALAEYRHEHDDYPESLSPLVPEFLEGIPRDLYNNARPIYKRRETGYLLYSVYENEVDDGGTDYGGYVVRGNYVDVRSNIAMDQSDQVIRIPVPRFRIPPMDTDN